MELREISISMFQGQLSVYLHEKDVWRAESTSVQIKNFESLATRESGIKSLNYELIYLA